MDYFSFLMTMKKFTLPDLILNTNVGESASSQIYSFLRERIIDNTAFPGTQLSENELAAHFHVSRQPVREALTRLRQDGLIEIIPQKGSFVKKISLPNLIGVCFVRSAIECNALYESLRLEDASFKEIVFKLAENLNQQKALGEHSTSLEFLHLDDEFHRLICSFSGSNLAWEMLQGVKANMDRIRFFTLENVSKPAHLIQGHEKIYESVASRDYFMACGLLRSHLYEITHTYKQVMEENKEWFL